MVDHTQVKMGALAPHPPERSNRVMLRPFLAESLPPPPVARDWTCGVRQRPMFGNDHAGDCTIVTIINLISAAMRLVYGHEYTPTTQEALEVYSALSGYDPSRADVFGNNPTDTGLVIEDVIAYVLKNGFRGHHFIASAAIDPHDIEAIKRSIDMFVTVDLGVALPKAWQNATVWTAGSSLSGANAPASWGRHSIGSDKYDAQYLYVWTWGELIPVEWAAVPQYFETVDAVITASAIKNGVSPQHINLTALEQRMSAMKKAA